MTLSTDKIDVDRLVLREAAWAVGWLMGLVEDERIDDLYPDDEYITRIARIDEQLQAALGNR